MSKVSKKLLQKNQYKYYSDCCRNCAHFGYEEQYVELLGDNGYKCTVDAHVFATDGAINYDQEVYRLPSPYGHCNKHERVPVKRIR